MHTALIITIWQARGDAWRAPENATLSTSHDHVLISVRRFPSYDVCGPFWSSMYKQVLSISPRGHSSRHTIYGGSFGMPFPYGYGIQVFD